MDGEAGEDRPDVGGFEFGERDVLSGAGATAGSGLELLDGGGEF